MKVLTDFAGQNWLITPAALATGEAPPKSIHDQKWLLVLTGVVIANLEGNSGAQWLHETLSFLPDMAGPQNSGPLNWAIGQYAIPKPPGTNYVIGFSLEGWAPFASLSSMFNQNQSINSGFAVDVWRPTHFSSGIDAFSQQSVGNVFSGINVDVAVRDTDAWLYRVGYNISLLGKIVFLTAPKTLFQSNFDSTPDGEVPATIQGVGTAKVEGPSGSVVVIDPTFVHSNKWVQISRPRGPDISSFLGLLTEADGVGVYNFSAIIFMASNSGIASISFETVSQEFLHLDFMPDNHVRIDDNSTTEFGSFPRNQAFEVQVTLNIGATGSTAHVVLAGGASGTTDYTLPPPFRVLAPGFAAVRVWQGFPNSGGFDATNIVVTRAA
jgi:hypothetical protein